MRVSAEQLYVHGSHKYYRRRSYKKFKFALLLLAECLKELFVSLSYLWVYSSEEKHLEEEVKHLRGKYFRENGGF